jgi:hypothetical protein
MADDEERRLMIRGERFTLGSCLTKDETNVVESMVKTRMRVR